MTVNFNEHPIIDTHAHLYDEHFKNDISDVINRAEDVNIKRIIIPATNYVTASESLELADRFSIIRVAVGIHPHQAKEYSLNEFQKIESLIKNDKVVAIGEIGLEYFYDFAPRDLQKEIFVNQLKLGIKNNLPSIIHTRDSIDDAIKIIEENFTKNLENQNKLNGVFHCFSGTYEQAKKLKQFGFLVSFNGNITFKNSPLIETVQKLNSGFMLETDSPYLTPIPFRGKRNEPSYVVYTLNKISEICKTDTEQIAEETTSFANRLFNLKLG